MYKLTKRFRFESAHRLAKGYIGKCSNIHGHSWNGEICLSSETVNEVDMSIDFYDMGTFVKNIEKALDHKILLHVDDFDLIALCRKNKFDLVVFSNNPTCETIAKYIYEIARTSFEKTNAKIEYVKIEETCTTSCSYSRPI